MLRRAMVQPNALPALIAISTAPRFSAGSAPGSPRQTGQTCVLGGAPNCVEQPQKIFDRVRSWAWTSRPMTGSKSATGMSAALQRRGQRGVGRLGGAGDAEQRLFVERSADQLQADGPFPRIETTGDGDARKPGQVGRDGVDVVQVHRERVVQLLAQLERRRRTRR